MNTAEILGRVYSGNFSVSLRSDFTWSADSPETVGEAELLDGLEFMDLQRFDDPIDVFLEEGAKALGWNLQRFATREEIRDGQCY